MSAKIRHFIIGLVFYLLLLIFDNQFPGMNPIQVRTLACALLMMYWWVSQALPLPVTSLVPAVLLPMSGVMSMKEAVGPYASTVIFLFLGGFLLALAIEKWNLHRRIALSLLHRIGTSQRRIIVVFLLATGFLSMWISNTATALVMIPIALSLIQTIEEAGGESHPNFPIAIMIAIAYAANIGGLGTIIGSPPNAIMIGLAEQTYNIQISFLDWMLFALPSVVLILVIAYFVLVRWYYPLEAKAMPAVKDMVLSELKKMGRAKGAELRVIIVFIVVLILWISRLSINQFLGYTFLSDPLIALLGGISLFIIPAPEKRNKESLITWNDTSRLPWGILLLFGGALSLAAALSSTGTIQLIGEVLSSFSSISKLGLFVLCISIMVFITEFMGGTALTSIFVPVLFVVATNFGMDPILLALPLTLASNCSFMLPVATPPNAIVFSTGHLSVAQMVKTGWIMNLVAIIVLIIITQLLGEAILGHYLP